MMRAMTLLREEWGLEPAPKSTVKLSRRIHLSMRCWTLPRDPANDNTAVQRLAEQLQELVAKGRIRRARALFSQMGPEERAHPLLARWARALAPPRVSVGAPGSAENTEENARWLREQAGNYGGQWVALRQGELVGHDANITTLHADLERRSELEGVVFVRLTSG